MKHSNHLMCATLIMAYALITVLSVFIKPECAVAGSLPAPAITGKSSASGSICFKWNKVSGADGYIVYKYNEDQDTYDACKTITSASRIIYEKAGLKSSTKYSYKVAAYKKESGSKTIGDMSNAVTVKTKKSRKMSIKNFTVYDKSGEKYKLSDFIGKTVVINIWATWCDPCVSELPDFNKCYKKYGDKVKFFMINCDGSGEPDDIDAFAKQKKYSFPVYYDFDYSADSAYGTGYFPSTVVINKKGKVIYRQSDAVSKRKLESLIKKAGK